MINRSEPSPDDVPFNLDEARFERRAIARSNSPLANPNDAGLDITKHVPDPRSRFRGVVPSLDEAATDISTRPLDELMGTWGDEGNSPEILNELMNRDAHHPNTTKPTSETPLVWLLNWVKKFWK